MKKIVLFIIAGLAIASCMNKWDTEAVSNDSFTSPFVGIPNTTISKVRTIYDSQISNSSYAEVKTDQVFEGVVVANDISGNIYQFIYLQGINEDGTVNTDEGGIAVGVKGIGCLYTLFPVGQVVRINLKGLYVGGYGASPRVGMPYVNTNGAMRLGPMSYSQMTTHIQKVGKPRPELVIAREMSADDFTGTNIGKYTPMLVVLKNAQISDAGWPYAHWEAGGDVYSETHDVTLNGKKLSQLLYISTSATFAGDTIREGNKTIYGLLGRYSSSYQLTPRSVEDIIELGK